MRPEEDIIEVIKTLWQVKFLSDISKGVITAHFGKEVNNFINHTMKERENDRFDMTLEEDMQLQLKCYCEAHNIQNIYKDKIDNRTYIQLLKEIIIVLVADTNDKDNDNVIRMYLASVLYSAIEYEATKYAKKAKE